MAEPLYVIVRSDTLQEYEEWRILNDPWLEAAGAIVHVVSTDATAEAGHMPYDGSGSIGLPDLEEIAGHELVSVDVKRVVSRNWRQAIERLAGTMRVTSATGRLLFKKRDENGQEIYGDRTPDLIAPYVLQWNLAADVHGVACSRLPDEFLWIAAHASQDFLFRLRRGASAAQAAEGVFMSAGFHSPGVNAYLPDIELMPR